MSQPMNVDLPSSAMPSDELEQMRAYLRTLPPVEARPDAGAPALPFASLPELAPETQRAIEAAALVANERYLNEFIEEHSFCPFARGGRAQGMTTRFVHYFSGDDVTPLVELMAKAATNPGWVIIQVILPLIDVSAQDWSRFCIDVTRYANTQLGTDNDVYTVAPLHPGLPYSTDNPFSIIPLFRRSPDPTIQWVRLDGLQGLYAGRSGDTAFVDPSDVDAYMEAKHRPPLFDHIAETNLRMANRLGVDHVEGALTEIAKTAQRRYADILIGGGAADEPTPSGCCGRRTDTEPPGHTVSAPTIQARRDGETWDLGSLTDLGKRTLRHVVADGIDLVVVRIDDEVHVLYGRCPHRLALLAGALLEGDHIVCPHHGWDFRLANGKSDGVPGAGVHRFAARVRDGHVWIDAGEVDAWRVAHPHAFELNEIVP